ncbi:H-NS family nucleoid-associated regulatory protein [Ralstonia pseudosolanacearum]|uniref:H-NS histone family protein n=1 Tax=Ralstonia pseudosolanacearum TaxID=1310165 RepID=UPI003CEB9CE8
MSLIHGELKIDFNNLQAHSEDEIETASVLLAQELERRRTTSRAKMIDDVTELIRIFGLTEEDLFSVRRARRSWKKSDLLYRNPDDPEQTWNGRGRAPRWIVDAEASGKSREDFKVEGSTPG